MPLIDEYKGIKFAMRLLDADHHFEPHVHAMYDKYEISIDFNGNVLAGSMPRKQLADIKYWLRIHAEPLRQAWSVAVTGEDSNLAKFFTTDKEAD